MQLLVVAAITAVLLAAVIDEAVAKTNKEWHDEIEKELAKLAVPGGKDPATLSADDRRQHEEDRRKQVIDVIEKVVKDQINERATACTKDPIALFYAGGTGAGKQFAADVVVKTDTTIMTHQQDPNCEFVILNHDSYLVLINEHVKPEFPQCFAPASGPILGVGSGLVGRLLTHAIAKGVSFAWDGTLNGVAKAKYFRDEMKKTPKTYTIHIIAVDADPVIAAERTFNRAADAGLRKGKDAKLQGTAAEQKIKHTEIGAFAALCQVWGSYATFRQVWQTILTEFGVPQKDRKGNVVAYKNVHFFVNNVNSDIPNPTKMPAKYALAFKADPHKHPAWFEVKLAKHNNPLLVEYLSWNKKCMMCGANDRNLDSFYAKVTDVQNEDTKSGTPAERFYKSMELNTPFLDYDSMCNDEDQHKIVCDKAHTDAKVCLEEPISGQLANWKKCPRTCGTCYTYVGGELDPQYATEAKKTRVAKKEAQAAEKAKNGQKTDLPTNMSNRDNAGKTK